MLISPAFLVDQKNVVYVRCSVHRIIISKVQLPLLLPFPDRDRASSVSTVETKPNHSWLKDSTSAKCSFHCSILSHHLAPFILSPGLFSQLHKASQIPCFCQQICMGTCFSVSKHRPH